MEQKQSDSIFDFNLVEFEQEFLEGKYDHLISQIKKPKCLQGRTGKKPEIKHVAQVKQIDKAELAKPVELVEKYITFTCKCCEGTARIMTQSLIKYKKRETFIYKELTVANAADAKNLPISGDIMETFQVIDKCFVCSEAHRPLTQPEEEVCQVNVPLCH